ncbi:hypothetical protein D9M68_817060 [compost metagenome]
MQDLCARHLHGNGESQPGRDPGCLFGRAGKDARGHRDIGLPQHLLGGGLVAGRAGNVGDAGGMPWRFDASRTGLPGSGQGRTWHGFADGG